MPNPELKVIQHILTGCVTLAFLVVQLYSMVNELPYCQNKKVVLKCQMTCPLVYVVGGKGNCNT